MDDERKYYVEIVSAFAERTIKRLWIVIVILIFLLFASNAAWIAYESQFEDITTTTTETVDAHSDSGDAYGAIVGDDSEVTFGGAGKGNSNN